MSASSAGAEPERPRGRPRSTRADRAILDAALSLFVEEGFDAMSIEGVAERAGVGKTTIYRRWASKEELVSAAVGELSADVELPDTGSAREDLVRLVEQVVRLLTSTPAGEALPRMVGEIASGSAVGRVYVENVLRPRRALAATAIRRGVERGELREGLDLELAVDALMGPVIVRRLIGGPRSSFPRALPAAVVDGLLDGIRSA